MTSTHCVVYLCWPISKVKRSRFLTKYLLGSDNVPYLEKPFPLLSECKISESSGIYLLLFLGNLNETKSFMKRPVSAEIEAAANAIVEKQHDQPTMAEPDETFTPSRDVSAASVVPETRSKRKELTPSPSKRSKKKTLSPLQVTPQHSASATPSASSLPNVSSVEVQPLASTPNPKVPSPSAPQASPAKGKGKSSRGRGKKKSTTSIASPSTSRSSSPAPQTSSTAPQTSSPAPQTLSPAPQASSPAPRGSSPAPRGSSPAPQTSSPAKGKGKSSRGRGKKKSTTLQASPSTSRSSSPAAQASKSSSSTASREPSPSTFKEYNRRAKSKEKQPSSSSRSSPPSPSREDVVGAGARYFDRNQIYCSTLNVIPSSFDESKETMDNFQILQLYSFIEADEALKAPPSFNPVPWHLSELRICRTERGDPFQVICSFYNEPQNDKKLRERFAQLFIKKNTADEKDKNYYCNFIQCKHRQPVPFVAKEYGIKHLLRRYCLFICSRCGARFHEKQAIVKHSAKNCKVIASALGEDTSSDEEFVPETTTEKRTKYQPTDREHEQDQHAELKIFLSSALARAKADGLLIGFPDIDALLKTNHSFSQSTDLNIISLGYIFGLLSKHEGRHADDGQPIEPADDLNFIWLERKKKFQIINVRTMNSINITELQRKCSTKVSQDDDGNFICQFERCVCNKELKAQDRDEVVAHIQKTNFSLVCSGCRGAFKSMTNLKRHYTTECITEELVPLFTESYRTYVTMYADLLEPTNHANVRFFFRIN